jgi:hypothetical protein
MAGLLGRDPSVLDAFFFFYLFCSLLLSSLVTGVPLRFVRKCTNGTKQIVMIEMFTEYNKI